MFELSFGDLTGYRDSMRMRGWGSEDPAAKEGTAAIVYSPWTPFFSLYPVH